MGIEPSSTAGVRRWVDCPPSPSSTAATRVQRLAHYLTDRSAMPDTLLSATLATRWSEDSGRRPVRKRSTMAMTRLRECGQSPSSTRSSGQVRSGHDETYLLLVIRFLYSVWNAQRVCSKRDYGNQSEYIFRTTINWYWDPVPSRSDSAFSGHGGLRISSPSTNPPTDSSSGSLWLLGSTDCPDRGDPRVMPTNRDASHSDDLQISKPSASGLDPKAGHREVLSIACSKVERVDRHTRDVSRRSIIQKKVSSASAFMLCDWTPPSIASQFGHTSCPR